MTNYIREYWKYVIGALFMHAAFAGLVVLASQSFARTPQVVPQLAIQAVVIDAEVLDRPARRERERLAAEQRRRDEQRKREEEERLRLEEEQRQQQELETQRQAEEQRQAEQVRREQAEAAEKQRVAAEAERKQRAEAERKRREQAEQERLAEIKRKQQEAEQRKRAEAERRAQQAREDQLQRELAEEEARMGAVNAGLLNQYIAMLQQRIERNWNRPPSAQPGLQCRVIVNQAPTGMVLSVQIRECNGDAAVRQSIEAAVLRSSPLPPPPDRRLFERTLDLMFRPME